MTQTDNKNSNESPKKDLKKKNGADSRGETSTATSAELAASKPLQSSGWRHWLKTALIATLVATASAQEVRTNMTTSLSTGYGHGTMLHPRGDLEQRFMLRGIANHPDSVQEKVEDPSPLPGRKLLSLSRRSRRERNRRAYFAQEMLVKASLAQKSEKSEKSEKRSPWRVEL